MQIGLMLEAQWGLTWARWQQLLKAAEEYGYQCLFRSDHFTIGPPDQDSLETWVSLTYAASHSQRIEFGPLVSPTTFRHPSMTVRMAAAIDDLSGGRLVIGLGAGWHEREHKQFGIPFYDVPTRFEMLTEALEVTTLLLRSDSPVNYVGKHYSLNDAILLPRPKRKTPILIGGNGPKKTLPLAAKYADEWNAVHIKASACKERNALLDDLLVKGGRKPGDLKRSVMMDIVYGATDAELSAKLAKSPRPTDESPEWDRIDGTGQAVVDQIGAYVDAGVERIMLMWPDQTDIAGLEKLARDVLPKFQ